MGCPKPTHMMCPDVVYVEDMYVSEREIDEDRNNFRWTVPYFMFEIEGTKQKMHREQIYYQNFTQLSHQLAFAPIAGGCMLFHQDLDISHAERDPTDSSIKIQAKKFLLTDTNGFTVDDRLLTVFHD